MAKNARGQPRGKVGAHNDAVVGLSKNETVHHMGTVREARTRECPRGKKFAQHQILHRQRQRRDQLDGACPSLFGPQSHGDGWHQKEIQPGMELKEGPEVRLPAVKEPANVEGKHAGQKQEHHQKDRRQGVAKYPENSRRNTILTLLTGLPPRGHHWSPNGTPYPWQNSRPPRRSRHQTLWCFVNHHFPLVDDDRSGANRFDFFQDVRRQHNGFALARTHF